MRTKQTRLEPRSFVLTFVVIGATLAVGSGCSGKNDPEAEKAAKKKAYEDAATVLKPSIARISAFLPQVALPDGKDPYAPAQQPSEVRAVTFAANELRFEASFARQGLQKSSAAVSAPLETALNAVATACADITEADKVTACVGTVDALNKALDAFGKEAAAAGANNKFPSIGKDAMTPEADAAVKLLITARGPGPAETDYRKKRSDPKTTYEDLDMACQNAQYEADAAKQTHAKSDDALQTIAAVRKMTAESHCNRIRAVGASRQNLELCKKGPKTPDCALSCGKVKAIIDDGIPAAAFGPLTKEHEENCKHLK